MSHMTADARLFAHLAGKHDDPHIMIRRGKLFGLRVRLSEAVSLADSLVDLFEQLQEEKAQAKAGDRP
ncbi:hypothetical protein ACU4IU_12615 [Brevibacterium sp. CSND-B09]|uniref:hypothetical protein n=1 Tax=Brevibacterium sp. CSND-B09 TaxID=3462571 RepID=UPI00406A2CA9